MDVAFVVVPFADVARPAIGVSLLKAGLAKRGHDSKVFYFNILLAEWMGIDLYTFVSDQTPSDAMVGEWFFADVTFPGELPPANDFVRDILTPIAPPEMLRRLNDARARRHEFIDYCATEISASGAPIVGFTTTFHQSCACLAIAKKLKALSNPPLIAFGGANCEGEMGQQMLRSFPWIDYVCTREGDFVFPDFVAKYFDSDQRTGFPGLLHRSEVENLVYPRIIEDMDSLPIPDYDDYTAQLKGSSLDGTVKREIQIETARGCWWGAKSHCTFCGLNGDTMRFRSKSPERVYQELKYLYDRHGFKRIDSVDNILDLRYIPLVFERLARENVHLEMFYEVKANLKLPQLQAMRRGGITAIQPGIESFSTPVLQLMKKGVSGFQNVQLLRWVEEVGIIPAWNILAGFPGESQAEYQMTAQLLPLLTHLEPPTGCAPIRLDRFSPLFNNAESRGIRRVRPTRAYYYVFPLGRRELHQLAYFFDFDYNDGRKPESYITAVQNEVVRWRNARFAPPPSEKPRLDAIWSEFGVEVIDTRACAVRGRHQLTGIEADILRVCDSALTLDGVQRQLGVSTASLDMIEMGLKKLIELKLLAPMDEFYLSLPVFRHRIDKDNAVDRNGHVSLASANSN